MMSNETENDTEEHDLEKDDIYENQINQEQVWPVHQFFEQKLTLKDQIMEHAENAAKTNLCYVTDLKVISRIEKIQLFIARIDLKPVTMSECSKINTEFCKLIDIYLPKVREKFNIEVASAGLDRVIKTVKEFKHAKEERISITYSIDNQQKHDVCFIFDAEDNCLHLMAENNILKFLKNDQCFKALQSFAKTHNEKIDKRTDYIFTVKMLMKLISAINQNDDSVAFLKKEEYYTLIRKLILPFQINYDKIIKVKLAPLL